MILPSRPPMKPPVIVAICIRCNDPVYAEEERVRTPLGTLHKRHVTGRPATQTRQPGGRR